MDNLNMFDILGEEYKQIVSNDWKWEFKDYPKEKTGLKVFSCFACGGGSTMGYKLAGCEVVGCLEIDKKMNDIYIKNHNPKFNYLMDIRDFNEIPNNELPEELFSLDVLDGSPPCTTFSMAGDREESWGKKKKFREGQTEQTLDDLSFIFIETANKLKPKLVIMENVEGLLKDEAWGYVQQIYKQFNDIGYQVKHWLLKGEYMGVPQTRHRVFFIAVRNDIKFNLNNLDMSFNYKPITYGEIKEGIREMRKDTEYYKLTCLAIKSDKSMADINLRINNKANSGFQTYLIDDTDIIPTIRAKPDIIDKKEKAYISAKTITNAQTFPQDYNFTNNTTSNIAYVCGMSVPPIMIKRIMTRLIESKIFLEE